MRRTFFLKTFIVLAASVAAIFGVNDLRTSGGHVSAQSGVTQGALQAVDPNGKPKALCPLKHTDVKAQISGFLSRVVVTQEFENPFKEKIEAVYTFPLPQNSAVDDMTMTVGDRTVRGKILRREEAQAVYEAAKSNGQTASLLDDIPTIGPSTRKKLLKTFGSIRGVMQARDFELEKVLGEKKAIILKQYLRPLKREQKLNTTDTPDL